MGGRHAGDAATGLRPGLDSIRESNRLNILGLKNEKYKKKARDECDYVEEKNGLGHNINLKSAQEGRADPHKWGNLGSKIKCHF